MRNVTKPTGLTEVVITTFGVLHGEAPSGDALTVDLRHALRNPFDDPAMRELTGFDQVVREHVLETEGAQDIIGDALGRIQAALTWARGWHDPRIVEVHVFCKGGRHRSVAVGQELCRSLTEDFGIGAEITHRDVDKPVVIRS